MNPNKLKQAEKSLGTTGDKKAWPSPVNYILKKHWSIDLDLK